MPADAHPSPIHVGEKKPYFGRITATTTGSTVTIVGTATCTLYDAAGDVAGGINGVAVTGQESGAQTELLVWYNLSTSSPPSGTPLTPGNYLLVFSINADGSDGINRDYDPRVLVVIKAANE